MKDDKHRWKDVSCSWIGRINIVKNDHNTQGNLQTQCNNYQTTNGIFHTTRTKKVLIFMQTQMTPKNQKTVRWTKLEESFWLQIIPQSYSNQNSMVLAQKETHRSMEQHKNPRNKSMYLEPINLRHSRQEYTMEKRHSLQ